MNMRIALRIYPILTSGIILAILFSVLSKYKPGSAQLLYDLHLYTTHRNMYLIYSIHILLVLFESFQECNLAILLHYATLW